jgi:dienelactone hydrolase
VEGVSIEFLSQGARIRGRFFRAPDPSPAPTLLLVPGWPGNPDDVLGLGGLLPPRGVSVCMFHPRGMHRSEGQARHAEVQQRLGVDAARLVLGGWSYGGGMALAYAAQDPSVRRVVSLAGNDHAAFSRAVQRDEAFGAWIRDALRSTQAPEGPVRFDLEATLQELVDHPEVYGLRENAAALADRSLLLIGGWEDQQVPWDAILLPFYRALRRAGADQVTCLVYPAGHDFATVRPRLASDVAAWVRSGGGPS